MNQVVENLRKELNKTRTEKGDVAYDTTFNRNLDLFALMGGKRFIPEELIDLFHFAYLEDPRLALKNILHLRNVRGGLGERDSTRAVIEYMVEKDLPEAYVLLDLIPQVGRWDDILFLIDTDNDSFRQILIEVVKNQLEEDLAASDVNTSLLAKWMPSINASKKVRPMAIAWAKALGLSHKDYRKMLSTLRNKIGILETKITNKDYDFDYKHVPNGALIKYIKAFRRNDEEHYEKYVEDLKEGKEKRNVENLFPHEIISLNEGESKMRQALWDNFDRSEMEGNVIVVRDGSGSMTCNNFLPYNVATALAILFSENLTGEFKNKFITFSDNPKLVEFPEDASLSDRLNICSRYMDCTNTYIEKVYDVILEASRKVENPEDYIEKIVIISDMEFDMGVNDPDSSVFENAKERFEEAGIPFPQIVFWNVASRGNHVPTTDIEHVQLVSGFSNAALKNVINGGSLNAVDLMLIALEPYEKMLEPYNILWENK